MKNLFKNLKNRRAKIAVVGLGYVGLPLAHAFSLKYDVVGFDLNAAKIDLMKSGIDPYYLTYKAEEVGYHPEVILSGCRINDNMGKFVGDIRNTKVVDIISELNEYMVETMIYDPFASAGEVRHEYGLEIERQEVANAWPPHDCVRPGEPSLEAVPPVDAVILAVPHEKFVKELTGEPCGISGSNR